MIVSPRSLSFILILHYLCFGYHINSSTSTLFIVHFDSVFFNFVVVFLFTFWLTFFFLLMVIVVVKWTLLLIFHILLLLLSWKWILFIWFWFLYTMTFLFLLYPCHFLFSFIISCTFFFFFLTICVEIKLSVCIILVDVLLGIIRIFFRIVEEWTFAKNIIFLLILWCRLDLFSLFLNHFLLFLSVLSG